ncbi:Uncharacterised protein [Bordetella pertussis]|nr:Uncharacterised protein [Bordetella pertussis]
MDPAASFQAEAARRADPVQPVGPGPVRHLAALPQADAVAHVQARQVGDLERAHGEAPVAQRRVDLHGHGALVHHQGRLPQILMPHAVADEAVAHAGHHGGLAQAPRQPLRGGHHIGVGGRAAHDLEQGHHRRGAEEMQPHHVLRAPRAVRDPVDIQRRRVGAQDGAGLEDPVQLAENRAFHRHVLEHRLDGEIGLRDAGHLAGCRDGGDTLLGLPGREPLARGQALEMLAYLRAPLRQPVGVHVVPDHRQAGVGQADDNAGAHRASRGRGRSAKKA